MNNRMVKKIIEQHYVLSIYHDVISTYSKINKIIYSVMIIIDIFRNNNTIMIL